MTDKTIELMFEAPRSGEPLAVSLPLSKSIAARLLLLGAAAGVHPDELVPESDNLSEDISVMREASGIIARAYKDEGMSARLTQHIDLKASGTAKRLLTAWFACMPGMRVRMRQSVRLSQRTIAPLIDALHSIGAGRVSASAEQGNALCIEGKLPLHTDKCITLPGNISSQFVTALMLAAVRFPKGIKIQLIPPIVSAAYIAMTAHLMNVCGITTRFDTQSGIVEVTGGILRAPVPSMIEADWSSASYLYEYVSLSGQPVCIPRLKGDSCQGDSKCAAIFHSLGVRTTFTEKGALIAPIEVTAECFKADMADTPDLVPAVAVTCAMRGLPFEISGVSHLRIKESDRLEAISTNLRAFGLNVKAAGDTLSWDGHGVPRQLRSPLPVYDDHRIVMSFALTAIRVPGVTLLDPDAVNKSFPGFWTQMRNLGLAQCRS